MNSAYAASQIPKMAPPPMRKAVEGDWHDLARDCAEPNPFYHPAVLRPALDHLDPAGRVRVLEAHADGRLIGLMPVMPETRHGRYPLRNASNWMHDQCFFGAPLLRKGQEAAAWTTLLAQLDAVDWSGYFLHLQGMDAEGPAASALRTCCRNERRSLKAIARHDRALLRSPLDADAYWQANVRAKKRKEIRRLINRLEEIGTVTRRHFGPGDDVADWTRDFLKLEASGWKGAEGTALGSVDATQAYFIAILARAAEEDMLDMLRIDVNGQAMAMLVNFRHGRGGFSYKIAFDEAFARYSPGILIEIDNLRAVLGDGDGPRTLDWMDSCAAPDHPMIDGIWSERRSIVQFRIALKGSRFRGMVRRAAFAATGRAEQVIQSIKGKRS